MQHTVLLGAVNVFSFLAREELHDTPAARPSPAQQAARPPARFLLRPHALPQCRTAICTRCPALSVKQPRVGTAGGSSAPGCAQLVLGVTVTSARPRCAARASSPSQL